MATVVGYLSVVMAYLRPNDVFKFLIQTYGTVALFVYLQIVISQLRLPSSVSPNWPATGTAAPRRADPRAGIRSAGARDTGRPPRRRVAEAVGRVARI